MTKLTAEQIGRALRTRRLGRPALAFDHVGSTNDVALERAAAGARDGLLVVAEEQLAGRGRLDRTWWAPAGTCLLMSLMLAPGQRGPVFPLHRSGQLTMCLGLGALEAVEVVTGLVVRLKWPNDLLVRGRKLGGMLAELHPDSNTLAYAVLGLGLNVNVDFVAGGAPPDLAGTATSLQSETGHPVDRLALLAAILERTERWYERVLAGESPHAVWAQHLDTLGRQVRVSLISGVIEGVAAGVTPEGALVVQEESGALQTVWSGDVASLR